MKFEFYSIYQKSKIRFMKNDLFNAIFYFKGKKLISTIKTRKIMKKNDFFNLGSSTM